MEISGSMVLAAILKSSLFSTLYTFSFTLKVTIANFMSGLKNILLIDYKTYNTLNAAEELLSLLQKENLRDKIIILRLSGIIERE